MENPLKPSVKHWKHYPMTELAHKNSQSPYNAL